MVLGESRGARNSITGALSGLFKERGVDASAHHRAYSNTVEFTEGALPTREDVAQVIEGYKTAVGDKALGGLEIQIDCGEAAETIVPAP